MGSLVRRLVIGNLGDDKRRPGERVDRRGVNLAGANLSHADFSGAKLSSANLRGADLSGANLFGRDLSHANLTEADLTA